MQQVEPQCPRTDDRELEQLVRRELLARRADEPDTACPEAHRLAAFVERRLAERQRARVEAHLADCAPCLDTVVAVARLECERMPPVPPRLVARAGSAVAVRPRRAAALVLAAAAAVLALLAAGQAWRATRAPALPGGAVQVAPAPADVPSPSVRSGPEAGEGAPRLEWPTEGAVLGVRDLEVRWAAVADALDYELRLTDADGDLLWERRTELTALAVPPQTRLRSGEDYFVWVRARLPGGASSASAVVLFHVDASVQEGVSR
jgi:hypothetical protein